jgi:hypothetical protein
MRRLFPFATPLMPERPYLINSTLIVMMLFLPTNAKKNYHTGKFLQLYCFEIIRNRRDGQKDSTNARHGFLEGYMLFIVPNHPAEISG